MARTNIPRPLKKVWPAAVFCLLAAALLQAGALPKARPDEVGLSAERLARLTEVMQGYITEGKIAGMVTLVARNGRVAYIHPFGKLDLRGADMPADGIFRIASQTKAVTSVAVMILQEEGKLLIDDPVARYIPEFAHTRVAVPSEDKKNPKGYSVVPAKRRITIRDLLTHTAGISYGDGLAQAEYLAAGIQGWFLADQKRPIGEVVKTLATLPFDAQPGERWVYGYNTDILGCLVERVSGMTLAEFFAQKITGPLGMKDTHFFLPEDKIDRFTSVYGAEGGGIKLEEDARDNSYVKGPRTCYAGGAGLLSTAEDYARFLLMLEGGGMLGAARILSPKSVELMTVDHVGDLYNPGFGLGFWVTERLGGDGQPGTVGAFGWGGAYHTTYWVDPAENLVAVLMTQLMPAGNSDLHARFRSMVYQSIVDSYSGGRSPK
jgi:CubicO group peptidase (beta-lactamase class C family)